MEEGKMSENHLTSAAAFVEGGIQDACEDTCSICLEAFCESDPSTVTGCKHEFHLQCILECQELLDVVEHERNIRMNPPRNTTIFHHPTLGDFELQHLPVSATDSELEERIIQHLAAAAAMGRARHLARRDGQRGRSSAQGRPQFLVFSTHPNSPPAGPASSPTLMTGGESASPASVSASSSPIVSVGEGSTQIFTTPPVQADQVSASGSGSSAVINHLGTSSNNRRSPSQSLPNNQERAGPSDLQSLSESIKSRFAAMSLRYKESITKSTRGWKERFFSRNSSTSDHGAEARHEVSTGTAVIPHVVEHWETTEGSRNDSPESNRSEGSLPAQHADQRISETGRDCSLTEGNGQSLCAASSGSN